MLQNSTVTSFTPPTHSIIENTCENPIQLPNNLENKEHFVLKELYGFDNFREGQLEAISSFTQGKDTLVLIPTGGGKSAIYTVAGILMQGLCVVIEPLKFIMEVQAQKTKSLANSCILL